MSSLVTFNMACMIEVYKDEKLAMRIAVTKVEPAVAVDDSSFVLKGHEYKRQFTAEARKFPGNYSVPRTAKRVGRWRAMGVLGMARSGVVTRWKPSLSQR